MPDERIFIVHLRRPKSKKIDPKEQRDDPFWEFGSFGITGCHTSNLMNPRKADRLDGARFAFAQGGPSGTRLVYLTPPVKVIRHARLIQLIWKPDEWPFRYAKAPLLVNKEGVSHFPQLRALLIGGNRTTLEGQFASLFRSSATHLKSAIARELIRVYEKKRKQASDLDIAACYADALPKAPPVTDSERKRTFDRLVMEANACQLAKAYAANAPRNRALCKEFALTEMKAQNEGRPNRPWRRGCKKKL